jgi:hypothetical protein
MENEKAVSAMAQAADAQSAIPAHHAPELGTESGGRSS